MEELWKQYTSGVQWPLELIVADAVVALQKNSEKSRFVMILSYLLSAEKEGNSASFYDINLLLEHEKPGCIEELVTRIVNGAPERTPESKDITTTRELEETSRATTLHYGSMAQGKASANLNKELRVQALKNPN